MEEEQRNGGGGNGGRKGEPNKMDVWKVGRRIRPVVEVRKRERMFVDEWRKTENERVDGRRRVE